MRETVYKVLRQYENRLVSHSVASGDMVFYQKRGWTTPRIKRSLLLAFESLETARQYAGTYLVGGRLWLFEAKGIDPIHIYNVAHTMGDFAAFWAHFHDESRPYDGYTDHAPWGTVGVRGIWLETPLLIGDTTYSLDLVEPNGEQLSEIGWTR